MEKRRKLQEQIQEAQQQIDKINSDVSLSVEGKAMKIKPIREKISELLQSEISEL